MQRRFPLPGARKFLKLGGGAQQRCNFGFWNSNTSSLVSTPDFAHTLAKFAVIVGFKPKVATTQMGIYTHGQSGGTLSFAIYLDSTGHLTFDTTKNGSSLDGRLITTGTYAAGTQYNGLFYFDSANSTGGDRMRIWINGTEVTSFGTDTNPTGAVFDSSAVFRIGAYEAATPFNGVIYGPATFIDNALPDPTTVFDANGNFVNPAATAGAISSIYMRPDGTAFDAIQGISCTVVSAEPIAAI